MSRAAGAAASTPAATSAVDRHAPSTARPRITLTFDEAGDDLLSRDPLALLVGMLLDQQMPMERAFLGPAKLAQRLGTSTLSAADIAAADPQAFEQLCATPPAVHRFPKAMAGRIQALAAHVEQEWDGDASALWRTAPTGAEVRRRLERLPGFGAAKAAIFTALLGKQLGVRPPGWEEACAPYGEPGFRSVADVVDHDSLVKVRATKQEAKRAAKAAAAPAAG